MSAETGEAGSRERRPVYPLVALDLESILVPEIWQAVSEIAGVGDLCVTTRDVSDYHALMKKRIALCREHEIPFSHVLRIVRSLEPLPGAAEFLSWLRGLAPVVILSDTFFELAFSLLDRLDYPLLLCNSLEIGSDGYISGFHLRKEDGKGKGVLAFRNLGYRVIAIGDSYNDITMLSEADVGILFKPPVNLARQFSRFLVAHSYEDLRRALIAAGIKK